MELYKNPEMPVDLRVEDLLRRMTLSEKAGQLCQKLYGFDMYSFSKEGDIEIDKSLEREVEKYSGLGFLYGLYRADPWSAKNHENGITLEKRNAVYNKIQRYVIEHSRLGIPMAMTTECPHGHQALDGTIIPVNLGTGSTFNPKLYGEACKENAREMKAAGVNMALVSMLDILRDPRWGRSEECFSEDPYLASQFATEAVTNMQSEGVMVVAKHFCAQGEGTGGINASAAAIGTRELFDIHLPVAKRICEDKVCGIMAAYNEIDGIPCHANKHLLTDILRGEFGFDGIVMSDGVAIDRLTDMTESYEEAAALALNSGVDVGLWDTSFSHIKEAVLHGLISEERLNEAVSRVLKFKFSQGLFDNPYLPEETYTPSCREISRKLSEESFVLLKNEGVLPAKEERILITGNNADSFYSLIGDYSPPFRKKEQKTIREAFSDSEYAKGCFRTETTEEMLCEAAKKAEKCDICICVLGGSSDRFTTKNDFDENGALLWREGQGDGVMDCGEGVDVSSLELPSAQLKLLRTVREKCAKVVTVVIGGRPYALSEVAALSDALVIGFYPGPETAEALYRIITGKAVPSGRLPVSIPRTTGQIPVYYNHRESYEAMKYSDCASGPLFSFGFGLGYSKLKYLNVKRCVQSNREKSILTFSLDIENTGEYDAYSILQIYLHRRKTEYVARVRELIGFKKIFVKSGTCVSTDISVDITGIKHADFFLCDEIKITSLTF